MQLGERVAERVRSPVRRAKATASRHSVDVALLRIREVERASRAGRARARAARRPPRRSARSTSSSSATRCGSTRPVSSSARAPSHRPREERVRRRRARDLDGLAIAFARAVEVARAEPRAARAQQQLDAPRRLRLGEIEQRQRALAVQRRLLVRHLRDRAFRRALRVADGAVDVAERRGLPEVVRELGEVRDLRLAVVIRERDRDRRWRAARSAAESPA